MSSPTSTAPGPTEEAWVALEEGRPFERSFTILIAVAATLAGIAGFYSAKAQNQEADARSEALAYVTEANRANSDGNLILAQDHLLFVQAQVASAEGNQDLAVALMSQSGFASSGYLDEEFNPRPEFGEDWDAAFDAAWAAYEADVFTEYFSNWDAAQVEFEKAATQSARALDLLGVTVIVAVGTMVGTVGMSARSRSMRLVLLAMLAIAVLLAAIWFAPA